MRKAESIRNMVERECKKRDIPFNKGLYRKVKKVYKSLLPEAQENFFKYFELKKL